MSSSAAATAIVAYEPSTIGTPNWKHQTVTLKRTEPGPNEVLVRMLASGICHTDIFCGSVPTGMYGVYPRVLGHEGSGYVQAVGSKVTTVAAGDPVLLSYTYCGDCDLCADSNTTYCQSFNVDNAHCDEKIWSTQNKDIGGKFFGQSSFSSLSLVSENSIVNVKGLVKENDDEELKKFSPLGCGLMTGSGAVINTAKAKSTDVILVTGLGAVGLAVIMAAKIQNCRTIIAADRISSRLEMAKSLGATHTFNASTLDPAHETYSTDLSKELKALSSDGKINFAFDTTGLLPVMNACLRSLSKRGKLIQIGVPVIKNPGVDSILPLDMIDFFGGTKRFEINYLGDCLAREQIPRMIGWYREGKFPFDRFVKFYAAGEFERALGDMKGDAIKPVIVH